MRICRGLVVGLSLSYSAAQAQQANSGAPLRAIEDGLRREAERLRQADRLPEASALRPPESPAATAPDTVETPCFPIRTAELTGPDAANFAWVLTQGDLDHRSCLGVEGIRRLVSSLDQHLLSRGFATSKISLPEQNLASGHLLLRLHAGRIDTLEMRAAARGEGTDPAVLLRGRNAFPIAPGKLLNIRDVEQGVEQARRLPSTTVAVRLEPGGPPDTSQVVVEGNVPTLAERLRGGITVDNSGTAVLGRTQLAGNLALDNPLGLSDLVGISVNSNGEQLSSAHRSQSAAAYYSIPWGYDTFTVSGSQSRFAQYVQGTTARFLSSGTSATAEARWHHVAWRSASAKVGVQAAVSMRHARSYLDDTEVLVQRRRTTAFELGLTYKQLWAQSVFDGELALRRGVGWGKAQEDLVGAREGGPTLRPRVATFAASLATSFAAPSIPGPTTASGGPRNLQHTLAVRGQYSPDTTLSIDQIAIGGRGTVRGFTGDTVLLAEKGFYIRNELSGALPALWSASLEWFGAIDFGRVAGPSAALLPGRRLTGAAVGARGRARFLVFELALGVPVRRPAGFRGRSLVPTFSLSYLF
ncbi:ShlB/FhaC/HecB family hemolysin secretion/activation protein [Xylophilus ampelinus]|uniref:ShlB/FhaC/HecB family hemolysin secretion/activation protein n=1 Tax=Xylophilus ampelinus TaxID=54067 RepID=UPI00216AF01A|nr:ShlB/FhaC/HecB family hemolysin secretion/activation protein [Xylophilus ampelinus]MCS4511845.1 ShlB/FhaC/HecB family hemolysin secretion/activation protein [Xylophilus ampelinus]